MYEKTIVKSTLDRCLDRGLCILDKDMVGSLERCLDLILDKLNSQSENNPFQIARNMVVVLHKILTAKDESDLEKSYKRYLDQTQFSALLELYSESIKDGEYRKALIELHTTFSGRCSSLAVSNFGYWQKQFEKAKKDSNVANNMEEAQKNLDKANKDLQKVDDFVLQHRVEDFGGRLSLRM